MSILLAVVVGTAAGDLHAQDRRGLWGAGGVGAGLAGDAGVGAIVALRLGGTVSHRVLGGIEVLSIATHIAEARYRYTTYGAIMMLVYPGGRNWFVKAGVGPSVYRARCATGMIDSAAGLAMTTGLGYDLTIQHDISLTSDFSVAAHSEGRPCPGGATPPLRDMSPVLALTFAMTFH